MTDNCFVCLEKASYKFCDTCNGCVHKKCWKEYRDKNKIGKLDITIDEDNCMTIMHVLPLTITCPLCRSESNDVSVSTRSQTRPIRKDTLKRTLIYFINVYDEDPIQNSKHILNTLGRNIDIIRNDTEYFIGVSSMLKMLHSMNEDIEESIAHTYKLIYNKSIHDL